MSLCVVLGALALAGCGQSDSDKAKTTVQDFANALAHADGKRACDLATKDLAEKVTGSMTQLGAHGCADAFSTLQGTGVPRSPKVTSITVDGTTATARVEGDGGTQLQPKLEKVGDAWKVSDF